MKALLNCAQIARSFAEEDMRVELFTLCETVRDEGANRMTIIGTFETIQTNVFPARPRFDVAIRLRFWPGESLEHTLAIHIIDPDGQHTYPPATSSFVLGPFQGPYSQSLPVTLRLPDWEVSQPGEYGVDLFVDQRLEARLPLLILSTPLPADACHR